MTHLELSDLEAEALQQALQKMLKDLSYEIADTDSKDFRDGLKAKRDVLARIEQTLSAS